jgi:hypothetical protein
MTQVQSDLDHGAWMWAVCVEVRWVDGLKLVPFLIGLENANGTLVVSNFDHLCFRWFNLYLDPFFKGNLNLNREI